MGQGATSPTQAERELARKLFVAQNRANGALYPDGFGFMSRALQQPWFDKAREQLAKSVRA